MKADALRARYQEALRRQRPATRDGCPDPDTMLRILERELPERERLQHLDHIMGCADCVRDFELLRSVSLGAPRRRPALRPWLAAAAAVLLVVSGGLLWTTRQPTSAVGEDPLRGLPIDWQIAPAEGSVVSLPITFTWHALDEATGYRMELIDSTGIVVERLETADTTVQIAGSAGTAPGSYSWWAIAQLPGGRQARGAPVRFRIQPQ